MNRNSQFKKIPSQSDLNGSTWYLPSPVKQKCLEDGKEFSKLFATSKLKTIVYFIIIIISLKSGRLSNVLSAVAVWLLGTG